MFIDNFNRANSNSLGNPWFNSGTLTSSIDSNVASLSVGTTDRAAVLINTPVSNITIETTLLNADFARVMFRASDHLNGYFFGQSSNAYGLYKIVGGTVTQIGTYGTSTSLVIGDKIKILTIGTSIKCYLNNVLVIDINDSTFTNGKNHGLCGPTNSVVKFDDFKLEEI